MAETRIVIDVRRNDGDVTRLGGTAGIAVVTQLPSDIQAPVRRARPPWVSLRTDTNLQLVHALAGLIAVVRRDGPEILEAAIALSATMNAAHPEEQRILPHG